MPAGCCSVSACSRLVAALRGICAKLILLIKRGRGLYSVIKNPPSPSKKRGECGPLIKKKCSICANFFQPENYTFFGHPIPGFGSRSALKSMRIYNTGWIPTGQLFSSRTVVTILWSVGIHAAAKETISLAEVRFLDSCNHIVVCRYSRGGEGDHQLGKGSIPGQL